MPTVSQVLALPSEVITTAPPSSQRPASAYKAAVDQFMNESSQSRVTEPGEKEALFPDVPESETQLLQQLLTSAKTLTARQDLLNTLRLD